MLLKRTRKAAGLGVPSYAPIVQALSKLLAHKKGKLRKKFDIAYFVATEKLPLRKHPGICELEARHRVGLGSSYLNKTARRTFCHYIAKGFGRNSYKGKNISVLMNGTTDIWQH